MSKEVDRSARIAGAIREVAIGAKPETAARRLLAALAGNNDGATASIYFLDLGDARFKLFASHGREPEERSFSLEAAGVSPTNLSPTSAVSSSVAPFDEDRLPIVRQDTMIGLLNILSSDAGPDNVFRDAPFDVLSAVFVWLYEYQFASRLFGGIQKPIPYDRSQDWFLSELLSVIRKSSGMAYAAVREQAASGEQLRCLAVRGFGEDSSQDGLREMLTFEAIDENYPAFAEAMATGNVVAELDMDSPRNRFLKKHAALDEVQSYVVAPIKVGAEIFGTLSLATKVRYPFTPFELQGFTSIANGVGIAITNFRNHHDMVDRVGDIAVGASALEISTSVRHATGNILERCSYYLTNVKDEIDKPSDEVTAAIGELETELHLLADELQKFKVATERPTRDLEVVDLQERWEFAADALGGRMANLEIRASYDGPVLTIIGYGDWIGHLFINLMLNSMDAFERVTKKGGRKINLRVQKPDGAGNIEAIYSDTATGIVGQKLVGGLSHVTDIPVKQRIFEPHVTSKRDPDAGYLPQPGAGLGLFLVRKIMDDHSGSIDLLESREGVRFRLMFPQQLIEEKPNG